MTTTDPMAAATADSAQVVSTVSPGRRAVEVTYLVFGIIEGLLAIRLVLKLLGANPHAGFTNLIYGVTDFFMVPFRNLFPVVGVSSGSVLETSVVIAIIVYALVAWVLARLIVIMFFRNVTVSSRSSRGIGGPRPN